MIGLQEKKKGEKNNSQQMASLLNKLMDHTSLKNKALDYLTCSVITLDILLSVNFKGQINNFFSPMFSMYF